MPHAATGMKHTHQGLPVLVRRCLISPYPAFGILVEERALIGILQDVRNVHAKLLMFPAVGMQGGAGGFDLMVRTAIIPVSFIPYANHFYELGYDRLAEAGPKLRHRKAFFDHMISADNVALEAGCNVPELSSGDRGAAVMPVTIQIGFPLELQPCLNGLQEIFEPTHGKVRQVSKCGDWNIRHL